MSTTRTHLTFGVGLLGGPKVGTTSLLLRIKNDTFVDNKNITTVHDSCLKVVPIDDRTVCKLRVFDNVFKDNPGYTPVNLYRSISCAVLIYSVSDKQSLFHVKVWADEYERNHGGSLFMMGNKCDEEREVAAEDVEQLCEAIGCKKHFLVSTKTGKNIDEAFEEIARFLVQQEQDDGNDEPDTIRLGETVETSSRSSLSSNCSC